mgnify:CR=1 FL=1
MSGFLGNIDISTAMTIAAAIVIISCVWGSVIVTRKFYKERRFVRLMLWLLLDTYYNGDIPMV